MSGGTFAAIYSVVADIPYGTVVTYGQIARLVGNPRLSRVVGYAMHTCPPGLPSHRVVKKDGSLAPEQCFGEGVQRLLLEREGILFTMDGRVDMEELRVRYEE